MSFFLLRPFSSIPHNIFCHISVPIVCHSGDLQTRARHTAILVINSLPLQLSKFFFLHFQIIYQSASIVLTKRQDTEAARPYLDSVLFISIRIDWSYCLLWQDVATHHGCSMEQKRASASGQNVKQKRKGGANLTLPFKGIFSITRRLSNRSRF